MVDAPKQIGPYRLIEPLGAGGMGEVWLAQQEQPVRRRVALKLMRGGRDTEELVSRFASERQALAVMDHPHIAKIFDAGVTDGGRPYFVMELVQGVDIVTFCDERSLGITDRVRLFADVCRGVQHAHQKGLVHRDLKPSNILVSDEDGRPLPKVIDFGIAKAVTELDGSGSRLTRTGDFVGTFAYMSPEQANAEVDVDTRSDVYSLGVVLYELLTGVLPFDEGQMRGLGALAAVLESDPPAPSTRLASMINEIQDVARRRGTTGAVLLRGLRGDLDWVVGRALEKERDRRYQTPNELAAELERFLGDEPVEAGPPSGAYRFGKFVRRNRVPVTAGAVAALALLLGSAAATGGLLQARAAADEARTEAARSAAINRFLQDALSQADPWRGGEREVTLVEALDGVLGRIDDSFADQPLIAAEIRQNIGRTYGALGRFEQAERLHLEALERQRALLGEVSEGVALTRLSLSIAYRDQDRFDEAEPHARAALDVRRELLGADDPDTMDAAATLAEILNGAGRYDEAEAVLVEALQHVDTIADGGAMLARLTFALGNVVDRRDGDMARADSIYSAALAVSRRADLDVATLASAVDQAAVGKTNVAAYDEAEKLYQESVDLRRAAFGDDHPMVALARENLGVVYYRTGRYDEVLGILDQVLEARVRALGAESEPVGRTLANMATVLLQAGEPERARERNQQALDILAEKLGPDHPDLSILHRTMATIETRAGEYDEAEASLRSAIEIDTRALSEDHPRIANSIMMLGTVYMFRGDYEAAEGYLLRALEMSERHVAEGRLISARGALDTLARLYDAWGRPEEAARYRARVAQIDSGGG